MLTQYEVEKEARHLAYIQAFLEMPPHRLGAVALPGGGDETRHPAQQ